jgi:hypothetical protein
MVGSQNLFVAASGEKGENLVGSVEDHDFKISCVYQAYEEQESLIGLRFVALISFRLGLKWRIFRVVDQSRLMHLQIQSLISTILSLLNQGEASKQTIARVEGVAWFRIGGRTYFCD